jgi:hypothetical protein
MNKSRKLGSKLLMESLEQEQNFLSTASPGTKDILTLTFTLYVLICIYIEREAKEAPNKIITNLL